MNKSTAISLAGGVRELAEILGITSQAVYGWKDDVIPRRSLAMLRLRRAAWFRRPAKTESPTTESKQ